MYSELVDIQPRELKFTFEVKKQSSCSIRLVNNTYHHVAYKVKTTSPKKYCVRPNTGVLKPNSTCDFTVTMQAQRSAPPDMICKDKFLVQSTIVPAGTSDEDITPGMFSKDSGKYIEENKLRVILISPPNSPVLSPINGALTQVPVYEASLPKDEVLSRVEIVTPHHVVAKDEESEMVDEELKPAAELVDEELKPAAKLVDDKELKPVAQKVDTEELKPMAQKVDEEFKTAAQVAQMVDDMESKQAKDVEELKLVKDIEEMKSKLNQLESKLSEAEVTISKLTEERRLTIQERENLQQELAVFQSKRSGRRAQAGFPLLFVCMVALVSIMLGYLCHS